MARIKSTGFFSPLFSPGVFGRSAGLRSFARLGPSGLGRFMAFGYLGFQDIGSGKPSASCHAFKTALRPVRQNAPAHPGGSRDWHPRISERFGGQVHGNPRAVFFGGGDGRASLYRHRYRHRYRNRGRGRDQQIRFERPTPYPHTRPGIGSGPRGRGRVAIAIEEGLRVVGCGVRYWRTLDG